MTSTQSDIGLVRHEDMLQPFMLHKSAMRGRMVRLCPVVDSIVSRHAYPESVQRLLGELLSLAAMLSANLPPQGILTLQAKGDGPVSFLVADAVSGGGLRGYANLDETGIAAIEKLEAHEEAPALSDLMGKGYLAITFDTGKGEPYQGIVPLEGACLTEAVSHYFNQSQQLDVLFHLSIDRRTRADGSSRWAAGGIMLERIPEEGGKPSEETTEDIRGWDYNSLLVDTATREELLDPHLAPSALLYRLFNEGGVWIHDPQPLHAECRCSREKVSHVLASMSQEALEEMTVDGLVTVTCQFCSREEVFTEDDLNNLPI